MESNSNQEGAFILNNTLTNLVLTVEGIRAQGIGGIVGRAEDTNIHNSHVQGSIYAEGEGQNIGGVVGFYDIQKTGSVNNTSAQIF